MIDTTLAQRLAAFAAETSYDDLPPAVVESVKMRVLDTLGIMVAAARLPSSRAARQWAIDQRAQGHAAAVGVPTSLPANLAAFVNGVLAHSLDYDDTHLPSVLHPSATIVPTALAVGQQAGANGPALIRSIALGIEVCVRLGMAGYDAERGNSTFFEHGQHATSICGAMGGAVAAAALQGTENAVVHALGVAASMASGIIEANRTGGTVKRVHCGWAAHSAVAASELVELGLTGPPTSLEGRFGFFQAWLHGQFDASAVTDGLGEAWAVPDIFFKPYPANHFTHAAVDAAAALRERGIKPDDIVKLTLGVPAPNLRTIGEPIEVKRAPETGYMAQFSGPYAVVVGLMGGGGLGASLDDYTDALAVDPQRRTLMAKVSVVADEKCTAIFPHEFPAVLTAELTNGELLTEEILTTRGGPRRPLSLAELETKFRDNASRGLTPLSIERLAQTVGALEQVADLHELTDGLAFVDHHSETPAPTDRDQSEEHHA